MVERVGGAILAQAAAGDASVAFTPDHLPIVLLWLAAALGGSVLTAWFFYAIGAFKNKPLLPPRISGRMGWAGLGGAVLAIAWIWTAAGVTFGALDLDASDLMLTTALQTFTPIIAFLIAVLVLLKLGGKSIDPGLTRPGGFVVGMGWLAFVLPMLWATTLFALAVRLWLGQTVEDVHPLIEQIMAADDSTLLVLLVMQAVVAAPLVEELLFRGVLQTALGHGLGTVVGMQAGRWLAITAISLAFALVHPLWSAPTIFVLAMILGWLYERTGNLWVPIGLHFAFNAVSITLALLQASA